MVAVEPPMGGEVGVLIRGPLEVQARLQTVITDCCPVEDSRSWSGRTVRLISQSVNIMILSRISTIVI